MLGFVVYMVYGVWFGVWGSGLRAVNLIPDEEDRLLRSPLDTRTCLIRAKAEDAQADALCRVLHVHGLDDIFNIIQIP
jgi:hypothetical protein